MAAESRTEAGKAGLDLRVRVRVAETARRLLAADLAEKSAVFLSARLMRVMRPLTTLASPAGEAGEGKGEGEREGDNKLVVELRLINLELHTKRVIFLCAAAFHANSAVVCAFLSPRDDVAIASTSAGSLATAVMEARLYIVMSQLSGMVFFIVLKTFGCLSRLP